MHSILKAIFLNMDYYPFSRSFCMEKPHSWLSTDNPKWSLLRSKTVSYDLTSFAKAIGTQPTS